LRLCDKLEDGGKKFLLRLCVEVCLRLPQLQCCFTIFDLKRQLYSVKIAASSCILTQRSVKRPDHPAGEALADLLGDHLRRSFFPVYTGTRTPLLEAGATHSAFIDKLQCPDLRV